MESKCVVCKVNIRSSDLVECTCGKKYHKDSCAIQAIGKPAGVFDACCGDKRIMRDNTSQNASQAIIGPAKYESTSDTDSDSYQSPSHSSYNGSESSTPNAIITNAASASNRHSQQVPTSLALDNTITLTTLSPSLFTNSSSASVLFTSPITLSCIGESHGRPSTTVSTSIDRPRISTTLFYPQSQADYADPTLKGTSNSINDLQSPLSTLFSEKNSLQLQSKLDQLLSVCLSISNDHKTHKQEFLDFQIRQEEQHKDLQSTLVDSFRTVDKKFEIVHSRMNELENKVTRIANAQSIAKPLSGNRLVETNLRIDKLEKQLTTLAGSLQSSRSSSAQSIGRDGFSGARNDKNNISWSQEVVVFGIPGSTNEDLVSITRKICEIIDYNDVAAITLTDRIGSDKASDRPLRLRFRSQESCKLFLNSRRKKGKVMSTDLVPHVAGSSPRSILVYKRSPPHLIFLRKDILQQHPQFKQQDVWIGNNKVYVSLNGTILTIRDRYDLYKLPAPISSSLHQSQVNTSNHVHRRNSTSSLHRKSKNQLSQARSQQ